MFAAREALLRSCGWLIHLYTASGAVTALIALQFTMRGDFRGAFIVLAIALFVDSTDGPLARAIQIRRRIPVFDGATLDNIVDYLNYVAVPAFLMLRAGLLPVGASGLGIASFAMVASCYGFSRIDAKTADMYFRGFPSYWNLVAFYLFCCQLGPLINAAIVATLAAMVFAPIKFIYPNRTVPLRRLTLTLCAIWSVVTVALLFELPARNPILLYSSLVFIVYYLLMSLWLQIHAIVRPQREAS
jgi:phosphatidylcholine synthase